MTRRRIESYSSKIWASAGGLLIGGALILASALAVIEASIK